jgi:hypothetical protein
LAHSGKTWLAFSTPTSSDLIPDIHLAVSWQVGSARGAFLMLDY